MDDDLPGVLGGSRLLDQPAYRGEVAAWQAFLAVDRPVLVDVGFDHGRRLSHTATHHPDWGVAGLEVRRRRVEEAQARAERSGTDNLLAWRVDARMVFARHTPEDRLDVVEALFPDPWWKPAHRERRLLVTPRFVADVARALRPGGLLHIETDVADYAAHIAQVLDASSLALAPEAFALRPVCTAQSRRQWRCAQDGLPTHRFCAVKRSAWRDDRATVVA
jgi:tRNA (guanine-N(7)-)-methyltransferase